MSETRENVLKLKRKRTTQRARSSRFINKIDEFNESTPLEDIEHCLERLQDTLKNLTVLDDVIQDLLDDREYEEDVEGCEQYVDRSKRTILKAKSLIKRRTEADLASTSLTYPTGQTQSTFVPEVRLPTLKLEPFRGDIESWYRFWEQFESSVDKNPCVSDINKHVFLRGYLEGEPKFLVDGIAITGETYGQTKQILHSRYGDKNRIIQAHIDYLEGLKPTYSASPEELNDTFIECQRRIHALAALGEDVDVYGRILAPKLLRAFPEDICRRWLIHSKRINVPEHCLTQLLNFLNEEVQGALDTQKIRGDTLRTSYTPTAAALHVSFKPQQKREKQKRLFPPYCVFCEDKGHWAQDCRKVTTVRDRMEKVKSVGRCFLCLNRGHRVGQCPKRGKASCVKCKKQHHVSLCENGNALSTSVAKISTNNLNLSYLQTAKVWIRGPTGKSKLTRCILDTGSQSSFIHESLIDLLELDTIDRKDIVVNAFESTSQTSGSRRQVKFDIIGDYTNAKVSVHAFESSNVYSTHPTTPQDITNFIANNKIKLADPTDSSHNLPIEVLIGADHYWKIVKSQNPNRISPSLVLVPTLFGWILSGNRSSTTVAQTTVHHISLQESTMLDNAVRQFWELESIGIQEKQVRTFTAKEAMIVKDFQRSYFLEDGRRVVSLPRKKDVQFTSNIHTAEKRFKALKKRLKEDDEFRSMYNRQMSDYIIKGQVEIVPPNDSSEDIYYLPHHAVKKQTGGVIKYRIVFDASSHENGSPSLNDALETGPNLLPEILATLLRFRQYPSALVCDGSQAFLQLSLHENDRNLTRFFWYSTLPKTCGDYEVTDDIVTYRFTRLPFGLASSPFLLSATLKELASLYKEECPTAAMIIDKSTFMDDFTISVKGDDQAVLAYHELTRLLKHIRLPLSKWASNSMPLKGIWNAEGVDHRRETSVLGVNWNTEEDYLTFDFQHILDNLVEEHGSKRNVLRGTARFYDPLGLLAPVLITAKIIFQDIWRRGLSWEELLPHDLAQRWQHWISKLPQLTLLHVPRWIGASTTPEQSEVHVFCDASEKAYGAVLYLRSISEATHSVRIICSKCRLAPIKKITLPRLELLAALIGSRLLHYFAEETDFNIAQAVLWSDSRVTLGWIRSDPNRWKPFVSNRVNEILSHTAPSQWRHCPGEDNPADFLSRGLPADMLGVTDTWWNGPSWLVEEPALWPQEVMPNEISLPEARKLIPEVLLIDVRESLLDPSRFGSYWKVLHIMAWVLRFVQMTRGKKQYPSYLTAEEIDAAQVYWIHRVQEECFTAELTALSAGEPLPYTSKIARFNPFLEDGLIRLGGRLQFADLTKNEKHPLLLDGSHHFTHLLIRETHIRLHHLGVQVILSELRSNFWILKARQFIKKIINSCLPCKIIRCRRCEQLEAQLPMDRIQFQQPFTVCGIDFAGPLYVKAGAMTKKAYVVLFTCAVTRAVHLELATDMSTSKFLLAFQRFIGRRGLPSTIYSDNARTFHAANKEMSELWNVLNDSKLHTNLSHYRITWKFIAPRAAWWGGFWERMVGTTKRCLKRILGRAQVGEEELYTILVNIEATVNSRPITQNEDSSEILTPSHFLTGGKLTSLPVIKVPETNQNLTKVYQQRQRLVEMFGKRWKTEYLLQLRNYHEVKQPKRVTELRIGDIALLQENLKSPMMWTRGRICDLRPGRDNRVRTITLQLPDGSKVTRPVQLVVPLEVDRPGWGGCEEL